MNLAYSGQMFGAVTAEASCVLLFGLRGNVIRAVMQASAGKS
jgi:hypothetical protein